MHPPFFFNEFVPAAIGVLGLVVGSFLNVCIYRLPRNCLSLTSPGSRCNACQTPISWYDNIPVVSYLLLGGSCRHCGASISLQYPMIELLNAVLFVGAYVSVRSQLLFSPVEGAGTELSLAYLVTPEMRGFWGEVLIRMVMLSALVVISAVDLSFRIIPDAISLPGIVLGPLIGAVFPEHLQYFQALPSLSGAEPAALDGAVGAGLGVLIGGGMVYGIKVFGELVFRKPSMGFGDVKLMAALGGLMGWMSMPIVLLLASVIGSVVGIGVVLITDQHYIPFGPFLSVGAAGLLLSGRSVPDLLSMFGPVAFT